MYKGSEDPRENISRLDHNLLYCILNTTANRGERETLDDGGGESFIVKTVCHGA